MTEEKYQHGQKPKTKTKILVQTNSCLCMDTSCPFRFRACKSAVEKEARDHCDQTGHKVHVNLKMEYIFEPRN